MPPQPATPEIHEEALRKCIQKHFQEYESLTINSRFSRLRDLVSSISPFSLLPPLPQLHAVPHFVLTREISVSPDCRDLRRRQFLSLHPSICCSENSLVCAAASGIQLVRALISILVLTYIICLLSHAEWEPLRTQGARCGASQLSEQLGSYGVIGLPQHLAGNPVCQGRKLNERDKVRIMIDGSLLLWRGHWGMGAQGALENTYPFDMLTLTLTP